VSGQKIVLDEKQVAEVLSAVRHTSPRSWNIDNIAKLIQLIAMLFAACWALYQFLAFEKESKKLANELATLTYETQMSQTELRKRELQQSVLLKDLELKLGKFKNEREAHEVEYHTSYRFSKTAKLIAKKLRDLNKVYALFEITYDIDIKNESEVPFEISFWILDSYLSQISAELTNLDSKMVVSQFGAPANRWNPGSADHGAVDWERVNSWGAISAEASGHIKSSWEHVSPEVPLLRGGGGTGKWKPGESMSFSEKFLTRARKGSYFGVGANICFNRAEKDEDLYWNFRCVELPDDDKTREASR